MKRFRLCLVAAAVLGCTEAPSVSPGMFVQNDEFGLSVHFPDGLTVCTDLSGEHPVGFYAWLNRTTDCDSPKPESVASISVTAAYNAAFMKTPPLPGCADGSTAGLPGLDLSDLAFAQFPSRRCAIRVPDGSIEIYVSAQAGRQATHDIPADLAAAPAMNYDALLRTQPGRVREDLATLRAVLRRTTIQPPERTLPD